MEKVKYLIIGNGIAGLSAAKEIRANDPEGSITIIGNENLLTYYRIKLTEYICKDFKDEDLIVNKDNWYQEKNVNVLLNTTVNKIDFKNNKVIFKDGELEYEKILIATGSRPFVPPIPGKEKEGVFALRTLDNLHKLQEQLKNANEVVVIGGGLLGLEAAMSIKKLGKEVSIIEYGPYLLARQLDQEISIKLYEKLTDLGFKVYLSSQTQQILGDSKVTGLELNENREIKADVVLISSGVRPNLDLVLNTEVNVDKGLKVDEHLKSNLDNVYAAGDLIEINGMVLGLWTAANDQGKVAGANMSGKEMTYTQPRLFTTLKADGVDVFSAGDICNFDKVYQHIIVEEGIHHKLFVKDGKVSGVILFGDMKGVNGVRSAVVSNMDIDEYLKKDDRFK